MLHNTQGIVIHTVKFSETSIIVKIYTQLFGLQSYLVKGVRNSRTRMKPGLFQPLTLLDLSVYHKEKQGLQSLKEAQHLHLYQSLPFDIRKSSVALFIDELIYKTIKEEEPHPELFEFIKNACITLDTIDEGISHFHLLFSIRLSKYLGLIPHDNYSADYCYFDLEEGEFVRTVPSHPNSLSPTESLLFHLLLSAPDGTWPVLPFTSGERDMILEKILIYYRLHIPGFTGLQSHQVLRTVLS